MSVHPALRHNGLLHFTRCYSAKTLSVKSSCDPFFRQQLYSTSIQRIPRVAQPSIWHSIVPKAFRKPRDPNVPRTSHRSKEWNPATFYIVIFLLIGSNGIQIITLRNEYSTFCRKADQRIATLKEVLERLKRGEDVDVEKMLGTGDEEQEQEWEEGWSPA